MSSDKRQNLIEKLESHLGARVIVLVTGDRARLETKIASDILPLLSEHLSRMGKMEKLALFLYTPGGDLIVGWGIVNLLRQYCKKLIVLVPFRALSCGTLIALGADELVVGTHGMLSPIDPSVSSPYNPQAPGSNPVQPQILNVSVEDVAGFIDFATKVCGTSDESSKVEVLKLLVEKIHPMALGAVHRSREQSGNLAKRLLEKHMDNKELIDAIVKKLTTELPTHSYLIGRQEAIEDIKIPITEADELTDKAMWNLYKEYQDWLCLTQQFSPESDLGDKTVCSVSYDRAVIESIPDGSLWGQIFRSVIAISKIVISQPNIAGNIDQTNTRLISEGWINNPEQEQS